jgi:uncharacterized protein YdhG (YjbR/CyaY superfamily)
MKTGSRDIAAGMTADRSTKMGGKVIDEFIANSPEQARKKMKQIRSVIRRAAPKATETIAFGIPTFEFKGHLVHFSGYDAHVGFFPTPSVIRAFKKELKPYKWATGSVEFPLDKPLPVDLITRMVKLRVRESRVG